MPDLSSIRGILFDKDGTLIDFNRTWFPIIMGLARGAANGDEHRARGLVEQGGYIWQEERFVGGSVVAAGTVADLVMLWHPDLGDADRRARIVQYDSVMVELGARSAAGVAGLAVTLATLRERGLVLGIATNDSEAGARAAMAALGLTEFFSAIIGYDTVERPKPHADQLSLFARVTGLPASAIAMVGDNTHDLEMAHAAGAGAAIAVLSGNSTRDELAGRADMVLDSIAALPALWPVAG